MDAHTVQQAPVSSLSDPLDRQYLTLGAGLNDVGLLLTGQAGDVVRYFHDRDVYGLEGYPIIVAHCWHNQQQKYC